MFCSVGSWRTKLQLLQPMGGALATSACTADGTAAPAPHAAAAASAVTSVTNEPTRRSLRTAGPYLLSGGSRPPGRMDDDHGGDFGRFGKRSTGDGWQAVRSGRAGRTLGHREVLRGPAAGRSAGRALPGHRCDVPAGH